MIRKCLPYLAAAALLIWNCPTHAGSIPIVNAGFEDPITSGFTSSGATGWTLSGTGGGVWNINADPLGFWTVPAPEGNQIGWLSPAPAPGGPATYSQVLSSVLQADTTYTLTGEVGHPIGFGATNGTVYTVSLLAGTNVLASISGTGPEGSFAPFTVTFDSHGSSFVGQSLEIELSSSKAQTGFDAISLTAQSSVPEPSAIVLAGTGLAALVAFGLIRLKRTSLTPNRRFGNVSTGLCLRSGRHWSGSSRLPLRWVK